jgi:hypothetical protein
MAAHALGSISCLIVATWVGGLGQFFGSFFSSVDGGIVSFQQGWGLDEEIFWGWIEGGKDERKGR